MKEIRDLVVANSYEELKNLNEVIWENSSSIRINRYGVFYLEDKETWPKYFKYQEPWDLHCCGDYNEIIAEEVVNYLKDIKDELSVTIAYIDGIIEDVR